MTTQQGVMSGLALQATACLALLCMMLCILTPGPGMGHHVASAGGLFQVYHILFLSVDFSIGMDVSEQLRFLSGLLMFDIIFVL
jgi:hypothetical protein